MIISHDYGSSDLNCYALRHNGMISMLVAFLYLPKIAKPCNRQVHLEFW